MFTTETFVLHEILNNDIDMAYDRQLQPCWEIHSAMYDINNYQSITMI